MNGRRAIVGLCLLCTLALSALAAQSASAVTKGTTAYTCKEVVETPETAGFKREHCKKEDAVSTLAKYEHVEIAENTTTEITVSNEKTNAETNGAVGSVFKETLGGVETELTATTVTPTGVSSLINRKDPTTGEHYIEGTALYHYTGVKVAKPAKNCKLFTDEEKIKGVEGVVDVHLKFTTKGQGDFIKFEPATGSSFANFFVEGCSPTVPAIEGTWEITGSVKCPVDGATILCNHTEITTQNTLKGKGAKAGIEGPITVIGKHPELDKVYTPISVTTKETP